MLRQLIPVIVSVSLCATIAAERLVASNPVAPKPSTAAPAKSGTATPRKEERTETRFAWPVAGKRILVGYGERVNPKTNTVTLNPGINIAATGGASVKAAGEGKVSMVSWLPGFGTIVIIQHGNGYRTVYANLASAQVTKGKDVQPGQKIGMVRASRDGEFLHFEVWQNRTRHDPMSFLQ
jgi:murein DD-endopeptidase MepM/ murein hydrolase activator NlpD